MRPSWRFALVVLASTATAHADGKRCIDVQFTPSDNLQIVAWVADSTGAYIDTIFITQQTGTFGLGNRPGRYDFNSGPDWPYGRRITTFPVWAHRHGLEWDQLIFQDQNDDGLSHSTQQSSREPHYFRPMMRSEPMWDAETHSSSFGPFTDKGKFGPTKSQYPPRQDIMRSAEDAPSVVMYDELNPFDSV